jgi:hypothetical protein
VLTAGIGVVILTGLSVPEATATAASGTRVTTSSAPIRTPAATAAKVSPWVVWTVGGPDLRQAQLGYCDTRLAGLRRCGPIANLPASSAHVVGFFTAPGAWRVVVYGSGLRGLLTVTIPYAPGCSACRKARPVVKSIGPNAMFVRDAWGTLSGGVTAVLYSLHAPGKVATWDARGRLVALRNWPARLVIKPGITLPEASTRTLRNTTITGSGWDLVLRWRGVPVQLVSPPGSDFGSILPGPLS